MNKRHVTYLANFGILLSVVVSLAGFSNTASAVVDNSPDCDNVAVIRCGVFSKDKMREKASQGDVPKIFNALGVSQDDLKGEFVEGIVWKDGRVTVDGKVVATGAMTAGRNFGGTPIEGTNAGKYPTSKFVTEGQTAFVKMTNGKFDFAVIKACGNPVSAKPKDVTPAENPKPSYECVKLSVEKISRTKYKLTADATATGGATIEKYEFGFGDGYGITVNEKSYTYEYKKTGTFETSVVIHVKVDGKTKEVTSPACKKSITVGKEVTPAAEMCPYDESLPVDSPKCKEPGRGSEEEPVVATPVKAEPEAPQRIADTGPAALMSGIFGSSALGYGAYTYAMSRRDLIKKALGR